MLCEAEKKMHITQKQYSTVHNTKQYSTERNTKQYSTDRNTKQYSTDRNTKQYSTDHNTKQYSTGHNIKQYSTDHNTNSTVLIITLNTPIYSISSVASCSAYQDIPHNFMESTVYYKVHENVPQSSPEA
jgi:hypothetical protein